VASNEWSSSFVRIAPAVDEADSGRAIASLHESAGDVSVPIGIAPGPGRCRSRLTIHAVALFERADVLFSSPRAKRFVRQSAPLRKEEPDRCRGLFRDAIEEIVELIIFTLGKLVILMIVAFRAGDRRPEKDRSESITRSVTYLFMYSSGSAPPSVLLMPFRLNAVAMRCSSVASGNKSPRELLNRELVKSFVSR
jgi:hypothetical protein